jgi:hypothetical protein
MVSIHCPPGYEPGALPLRHSAVVSHTSDEKDRAIENIYLCNFPDTSILLSPKNMFNHLVYGTRKAQS